MRTTFKRGAGLLVITASVGCATTAMTKIDSSPPGAKAFLEGVPVGVTPLQIEVSNSIQTSAKQLRLEAPGYAPLNTQITNSEVNTSNMVGGYFCLFPLLWLHEVKPYYHFELKPLDGPAPTVMVPPFIPGS